jgi:hypothetical protein
MTTLFAAAFVLAPAQLPANLFWTHPRGDQGTVPCVHPTHPNGDQPLNAPCLCPKVAEHPGGHEKRDPLGNTVKTPCTHLVSPHPNGHELPKGPCSHRQHANGDPGPFTPCAHPMPIRSRADNLGVHFYTADADIRQFVTSAIHSLRSKGVRYPDPRVLKVFYREPTNGNINDNKDPFWSHYNPVFHSIQLTKGRPLPDLQETCSHELGHAMLGHTPVHIAPAGGPHSMATADSAAMGMSEGWAHFVGLVIGEKPASYKGYNWENGHEVTKTVRLEPNRDIPFSSKNEFRVGCILWDLYDGGKEAGDTVQVPFSELYRIYSPTLATLANGPVIPSIEDFLGRLKKNRPDLRARIDAVYKKNLKL